MRAAAVLNLESIIKHIPIPEYREKFTIEVQKPCRVNRG